ncbi:hypothetical protein SAMN05444161_3884 [Rhizobiales bacterium GAS191]|nr:hypothetical protein SAMN05444161_3884 [Rhizobiales bacterium GAS191]
MAKKKSFQQLLERYGFTITTSASDRLLRVAHPEMDYPVVFVIMMREIATVPVEPTEEIGTLTVDPKAVKVKMSIDPKGVKFKYPRKRK